MTTTNTTTRTPAIASEVNTGAGALTLTCRNGQSTTIRLAELSQDMLTQAALHGLKQKFVDAAAIGRDPITGREASIDVKWAATMEVVVRVLSGKWNKGADEANLGATGGLLYSALVRLYDGRQTPAKIREYLDGLDASAQAQLRDTPRVKSVIDEIKAERAIAAAKRTGAPVVDAEAMLADGLGALDA